MANDAKVVCKNVFKNCDRAAFTKAFTLKWIELINQYEKIKERQLLPDDRQTILQDVIITLCRDSLFRLLKGERSMIESKSRVAIYCRLSEEDRNKQSETDDSNSIQNQKSMLLQYSLEHGWEVYNIYSDDDYTGSDRRRPEFNRLLEDAKNRKFDIVLCKTQSRFTRELELVEKYIHGLFPIWGIRFISIVDNADTANKGNKKSRQINGLVNEWYLEDMSENIKSVLTDRRKNGHHIGAFALYGYKKTLT